MSASPPVRFRDREITLADGCAGRTLDIETADPRNYYQAISVRDAMPRSTIDGKLFLPKPSGGRLPCVIVVPGSLGVAPSHLSHAETLVKSGIAALVIDPFGARNVTSTVANQTQYSFAASAVDVLAALRTLSRVPEIDGRRIGAQGHSRGGSAVLTAATRVFAEAVLERGPRLRAVYAAYPWCGHQFLDPAVGDTVVRAVIGDQDEWCLPQQVQGHIQAIRLAGGGASIRIFEGAQHSFDRETPVEVVPDASVSPGAPTAYVADDGAFIHPLATDPDANLVDRDLMVYALKAGYGRKGARIGSSGDQPAAFRADMIQFWTRQLRENRR